MTNILLFKNKRLTKKILSKTCLKEDVFFKLRVINVFIFLLLILQVMNPNKKLLLNNKNTLVELFIELSDFLKNNNLFLKIEENKNEYDKLIILKNEFNDFSARITDFCLENKLFNQAEKREDLKELISFSCLYFLFNSIDNYFSIKIAENITNNYESKVKFAIIFCHLTKDFQKLIRTVTELKANEVIVSVNKIIKKMY